MKKLKVTKNMTFGKKNAYLAFNELYNIEEADIKKKQALEKYTMEYIDECLEKLKSFQKDLRKEMVEAEDDNALGSIMSRAAKNFDFENPILDYVMDEDEKDVRNYLLKSLSCIARMSISDPVRAVEQFSLLKKAFIGKDACPFDEEWFDHKLKILKGRTA